MDYDYNILKQLENAVRKTQSRKQMYVHCDHDYKGVPGFPFIGKLRWCRKCESNPWSVFMPEATLPSENYVQISPGTCPA